MNRVIQALFKLVAPSYCVNCHKFLVQDEFLCPPCTGAIVPIATKTIAITDKYKAKVFAVSDYQEPLRSLIVAKHYGNRLASKQLGQLIWQRTDIRFAEFDIIVPVPLHWTRYAWRWFNQAEVIAAEISKQTGKPVVSLLKRIKYTHYQTTLPRKRRLTNLSDAFEPTGLAKEYKGKSILLVDDVMTTGTTLHHCLRAIVKIAPKNNLVVAVACRTL